MKTLPVVTFDCDRTCKWLTEDVCKFMPAFRGLFDYTINSNATACRVVVTNLAVLERAAERLGLEFVEGKRTYRWHGHLVGQAPEGFTAADMGKCDHALRVKGAGNCYEVGVCKPRNGSSGFRLVADTWGNETQGGRIREACGEDLEKLSVAYAQEVVADNCHNLGWECRREGNKMEVNHPSGGTITVDDGTNFEAFGFNGVGCHEAVSQVSGGVGQVVDSVVKSESLLTDVQVDVN